MLPKRDFYSYENYRLSDFSPEEIEAYKKHTLIDTFPAGVAILLHYITCGIFSLIYIGLKHDKFPKVKHDDPGAGMAIGFMFIPFYNFYWLFIFWRRLAFRINLQYRLRGKEPRINDGLAQTACILNCIPYIGVISFLILYPILIAQMQEACNELAMENMNQQNVLDSHI